ncbi:hypothetical protein [Nocardioides sp. 1609]|uniref:hypothetical protein n=1 Tax=Nocardioides sp. 1609 TaxID=2508327 RepID=UPI00106FCDB6|nr:hypothetical protein [Nocardioides sp. 1609]
MLLPVKVAHGVRDGSVSLAYRRWRRQDVEPGRVFTTVAGLVRVEDVAVVDPAAISDADAVAAGWPDADRLRARLAGDESLPTYRVRLAWAGEDPRIALRESVDLTDDDVAELDRRLERLDRAAAHGAWTLAYLRMILERPEVRAPDLAASVGRETAPFKIDVRKLKNLGLTISHAVGYSISPRGEAYLARTRR